MKENNITTWSTFFSFLQIVLLLMFFGYAFVTYKPLPVKLGSAALGLCFLATYIGGTWPERRSADKLAKALNVCASGLFLSAMLLVVQHYFNTVSMT